MKNPLRYLRRKINLNTAKLKPNDLENLRIREAMANDQENLAQKERLKAIVILEAHEEYKRVLLKKYNLRPGKKYNFDLRDGTITKIKAAKVKKVADAPEEPPPDSKVAQEIAAKAQKIVEEVMDSQSGADAASSNNGQKTVTNPQVAHQPESQDSPSKAEAA